MGLFNKGKKVENKPAKTFEDAFMEKQIDMVDICLEYSNYKADNVYVYCSIENGAYSVGYFYAVNNRTFSREKLSEVINSVDDSPDSQGQVLKILMNDLMAVKKICVEFAHEIPMEMKIIYDNKNKKLNTNYEYKEILGNDINKTASDMEELWMKEIEESISKPFLF